MAVIDAHHHFLDPERVDYPWLTDELAVLRRTYGPDELRPLLAQHAVGATVVVQTISSVDETAELLATAEAVGFVAGVVGWVDLTAPDVGDTIAALRAGRGGGRLVGVRHQVHDEADPGWLLRADVLRGLTALRDAGLAYDLLVRPRELPAAVEVVHALDDLRFVVDHAAKPRIASGETEGWLEPMAQLAAAANVTCKLSGLVTEAGSGWTPADLAPYADAVLAGFGPTRVMFGSDWPVCLLAADYATVLATAQGLLAGLSPDERAAVFGGTAAATYGLAS
jgi:L-fuconolactonase